LIQLFSDYFSAPFPVGATRFLYSRAEPPTKSTLRGLTLSVEGPSLPEGVSGVPHLHNVLPLARVGDFTVTSVVDEIGRLTTRTDLAHDGTTVYSKDLR